MAENKFKKAALETIRRVPSFCCSTIDLTACPDIRIMWNLRSKYVYPKLQSFFKAKNFDSYIPVNTYSTKLLQIKKRTKLVCFILMSAPGRMCFYTAK